MTTSIKVSASDADKSRADRLDRLRVAVEALNMASDVVMLADHKGVLTVSSLRPLRQSEKDVFISLWKAFGEYDVHFLKLKAEEDNG